MLFISDHSTKNQLCQKIKCFLINAFCYNFSLQALYYCKPRVREGLSPTLNSFTRSASSPHSPSSSYSPSHPSVCPSNPDLIAFICHKDIYVLNTKCQGQAVETRLTFTYKPPETPKVRLFFVFLEHINTTKFCVNERNG